MAKKTNCIINGIPYYRKYVTINGSRKMIYGESEKDWQRKVDELKQLDTLGLIVTNETVGEGMQHYIYEILTQNPNIKASTYSIHESVYRNRISTSHICGVKVCHCKTIHIQRFINDEIENGRSANSVHMSVRLLNMFFKYAVQEGYIFKNPCTNAMTPKIPKSEKIEVYSYSELQKIIKSLDGTRYRFLFLTILSCGLRLGEALALEPQDFNWEKGYLSITKQQQNVRTVVDRKGNMEYEIKDVIPKTEKGQRIVPLPKRLKKEYNVHLLNCKEEFLSHGKPFDFTDKLFLTKNGLRCQQAQIGKEWKKISIKAEVEYKHVHCLRHTFITKLIQSGENLVTVMEVAGHSKYETTLRYTHIEEEYKISDRGILDGIL